jgi:hypothetical protein
MAEAGSVRAGRPGFEAWYERWAFPPVRSSRPNADVRRFDTSGFVCGLNLPWLAYGCDFGASAWRPTGGVSEPATRAALRAHLSRQANAGITLVRWFVFCDGRSGIVVTPQDLPARLDDRVAADMDTALDELQRAGMRAIFVLFDFLLGARPREEAGVRMGGRARWLANADARAALVERVVRPFAATCGKDAPVAAWDILNEPEWLRGVPRRHTQQFLAAAAECLHDASPFPVTAGLASAGGLDLVRPAGLDFYQVHWYDRHELRHPLATPVTHFGLDAPVLLGEYPTRGSRRTAGEIVEPAKRAGYAGALAWSALARDDASAVD